MDRIVLAYSGGLETSAAISWLAGKYRAEVVTLTLDVGQGSTLDDVRERALAIGAVRAHVLDAREDLARRFVLPALQAGAIGHGGDPLAAALTRPLIARKLVEIAHIEGAKAVAHGDHRFGSAPGAIDRSVAAIDPAIKVIPLAQAWGQSRAQLIPYAKERGIPIPPNVDRSYHTDANLWGRSIQCGLLVDAWQDVPEDLFAMAKSADDAPDRPAFVEIQFEHGEPVKLNGIAMSLVELIQSLETIAGAHAIGRADRLDSSVEGAASREIYDAPAATVLAMKGRAPVSTSLLKINLPRPAETDLANGMHLMVLEDHRLPQVTFQLIIPGAGGYFDPADTPGLASMTATMSRCRITPRRAPESPPASRNLA